jgi:hypothetical protein
MRFKHNKIERTNANYRTWKKGKTWLYGCSVAAALAVGMIVSAQTANVETPIESSAAADTSGAEAISEEITKPSTPAESTEIQTSFSGTETITQSTTGKTTESAQTITSSDNTTKTSDSTIVDRSDLVKATVNATEAHINLLKYNSTEALPSDQTLNASQLQQIGIKGDFKVKTSDLATGNTIIIAEIKQTTDEPSGALAQLTSGSGPVTLIIEGQTVGTINYDPGLKAITLKVTNTLISEADTQTPSFDSKYMLCMNNRTPISIQQKMPFSNTLSVTGNDYHYDFNAPTPSVDATVLNADSIVNTQYATGGSIYFLLFHEDIPDNAGLMKLQNEAGAVGPVLENKGILEYARISTASDLKGFNSATVTLHSYFVSAGSNQIQSKTGNTIAAPFDAKTLSIPLENSGDGLSLAQLKERALANGSGSYYLLQKDNSYLFVNYVTPEDTVLTDAEIAAAVRSSSLAASSLDIEADVQATLDYYHGVIKNRASSMYI